MVAAVILIGMLIFLNNILRLKNYIFNLTRPLLDTVVQVRGFISDREKEKLLEENQHLKSLVFGLERLQMENSDLKKALSFAEETKIGVKGARVIFFSQGSGREFLIVDQGEGAGVQVGDLVVDGELFFLGTVKETGERFARVGLAANPGETFEVEIMSSRTKALARGLGAGSFAVELLPLDIILQTGDRVGLLSKQKFLPLAEIVIEKTVGGSTFKEARAVFLAHPELAREVFIISGKISF